MIIQIRSQAQTQHDDLGKYSNPINMYLTLTSKKGTEILKQITYIKKLKIKFGGNQTLTLLTYKAY